MNPKVEAVYTGYPDAFREKLLRLRDLIFSLEPGLDEMERIEESLKWGEPAYSTLGGTTVRLAWSDRRPDQYGVYFPCQTKLIETFREIYPNQFRYEGNRAIVFSLSDRVDEAALKNCILLAFTYHKRKHLPLLGVEGSEEDIIL